MANGSTMYGLLTSHVRAGDGRSVPPNRLTSRPQAEHRGDAGERQQRRARPLGEPPEPRAGGRAARRPAGFGATSTDARLDMVLIP